MLERGRNKRCVWSIGTTNFAGDHFAVYPPKLVETPIKAGCPEKGIVLDPFAGSGTTALVAAKLERRYIGIELNPKYVEVARRRIRTL
jgi:DNA modification methylase